MEHRIYRENIRVRHREADRNGRLKLLSWFDFLQEAAANHAARLGVGLNALTERGQLWVLSRLKLEIRRSPQIGEELTVETYPSGVNRLFFTREFQVFDKSGEVIAAPPARGCCCRRPNCDRCARISSPALSPTTRICRSISGWTKNCRGTMRLPRSLRCRSASQWRMSTAI